MGVLDMKRSVGDGVAPLNLPDIDDYENGEVEVKAVYHLNVERYRMEGWTEDRRFINQDIGIAGTLVVMYKR